MIVNKTSGSLATMGVLSVLGASLLWSAPAANAQGLPTDARPVRAGKMRGAEKHPEIRKALRHLQQAQAALQAAQHDFAGHREQALDLTQKAIAQCQSALTADRR